MATITSAGSGNWSAGSTWVGGVVPTSADTAVIASGHTVTLDTTGCAASAVTLNGSLTCSTTASSDLSVGTAITAAANSTLDLDVSGDPAVTCTLILNVGGVTTRGFAGAVNVGGMAKCSLKGAAKQRWTQLASAVAVGATSATVLDATGWRVGDIVAFGSTTPGANAITSSETVTLTSVSGNTVGWTGGLTYGYKINGYVGNMSSNMTVKSAGSTQAASTQFYVDVRSEPSSKPKLFSQVAFHAMGAGSGVSGALQLYSQYWKTESIQGIKDCAFYQHWCAAVRLDFGHANCPVERNVFWSSNVHSTASYNFHFALTGSINEPMKQNLFMRKTYADFYTAGGHPDYLETEDNVTVGCPKGILLSPFMKETRRIAACGAGAFGTVGTHIDCRYGVDFDDTQVRTWDIRQMCDVTVQDCMIPAGTVMESYWVSSLAVIGAPDSARFRIVNRNKDPSVQEVYTNMSYTEPTYSRNNSEVMRSTSSFKISPRKLNSQREHTFEVACPAGQSIRIVGYLKADTNFYNAGDWTAPKVSISGLGITPVVYTASSAANNAWEQFDLTATNTSGVDGKFTISYDVRAKTVTTGNVYIAGVPDLPFVTKCRHYGFDLTQEASPVRTVDPYVVASEATAAAYTGVTIDGTAKTIAFAAGTADTAQKFYDYTRAWACLNLAKDIPLTRAGALYGLTSGWTVIDPTYTGLTWGGGTVEFTTTGTKAISVDSCDLRFTAVGTYDLGGASISGTVELLNTSGGAVTVVLPLGASYTNTGPDITVTAPSTDVDITAPALISGSRVQLYNVTDSVELLNTVLLADGLTHTMAWTADKVVRLRADHATKLPLEVAGVFSESGLTFLDVQEEDAVYIANGIDGSAVTEFVPDGANIQVDINDPDGLTNVQRLYAWLQWYMTTAEGVASDFFGAVYALDGVNYVIDQSLANIKLDNISAIPLRLIGGSLTRKDGTTVIAATSGSIQIDPGRAYAVETGVSGLTTEESNRLLSIPVNPVLDTDSRLTNLDVAVSSRLASTGYTAPDNAGVAAIADAVSGLPTSADNAAATWAHAHGVATVAQLLEVWGRLGLDPSKPLVTGQASITFGDIAMALSEAGGSVTVTRQ